MPTKKSRSSRKTPKKTFVDGNGKPFLCQVCVRKKTAKPLAYPPVKMWLCLDRPKPIIIAAVKNKKMEAWTWEYQELCLCIPCATSALNELDPKTISLW